MSADARTPNITRHREEGSTEAPNALPLPNDAVRGMSRLLWSMEKAGLTSPWVCSGTPQYSPILLIGRLPGTGGVSDAI